MAKLLLILLIGLVFESAGVVLLKKGMGQIGEVGTFSVGNAAGVLKKGATNSYILTGIFFEALFFMSLLLLMSKSEISFLWPMTGLSFVFATFAAIWFLGEHVSMIRWAGVVLIMIGAGLISYSEQSKPKSSVLPVGTEVGTPTSPSSH
jgi:drug/metabolite transporter (DMT)-like permease